MSFESSLGQGQAEQPKKEIDTEGEARRMEKNLNDLIPILCHGLAQRLSREGLAGKVRVSAMAGKDWGVAKSPDNPTDTPNIIIYPRESLLGDRRLVNARLRHEIGNLNNPINNELNELRDWCRKNQIAPELLTSLVESVHEASVNYSEIKNSHSSNPEQNFRALYEKEINTGRIAENIAQSEPYKQAVDLTLLYCLAKANIIPKDQFEAALKNANPEVGKNFNKQTQSILDQSLRTASAKQKVLLIRDFVWPKLSSLAGLKSTFDERMPEAGENANKTAKKITKAELEDQKEGDKNQQKKEENKSPNQIQMEEMQGKLRDLMEKIGKQKTAAQEKTPGKKGQNKQNENKKKGQEPKKPPMNELSPAEKKEQKEISDQLAKNLQEQLQNAKKEIEKLQESKESKESNKASDELTPQDAATPEASPKAGDFEDQGGDEASKEPEETEPTSEQLEKLKEQLEQLEEVVRQLSESGELEKELFKETEDEEPIDFNIKEYGINEGDLTKEQLECLEKMRAFTKGTSRLYKKTLDVLFANYQKSNANFSDTVVKKLIDHKYDLPDFSIYGEQAAEEFFEEHKELGIDRYGNDFLLNFNLPRPLGKLWYKGGWGQKAQPVREGGIEWGLFYRMGMPAIWKAVDSSAANGLYLNRINQFGQHVPKEYYYLWQPMNATSDNQDNETDQSGESKEDQKAGQDSAGQGSEEKGDQPQDGQGSDGTGKESQEGQSGNQKGSGEGSEGSESGEAGAPSSKGGGEQASQSEQGGDQSGQEGSSDSAGAGKGGNGGSESSSEGIPSASQMQELLSQMQDAVGQVAGQGQGAGGANQEALSQLGEQLKQLQQELDGGGSAGDIAEKMENALQQMTDNLNQNQGGGQDSGLNDTPKGDGMLKPGEGDSGQGDEGKTESHDQFGPGGKTNERDAADLFGKPNEELLKQLRQAEELIGSKFSQQDGSGNITDKFSNQPVDKQISLPGNLRDDKQLRTLEEIKRQQEAKMESLYREMSHLDGEALRTYMGYMESTKDFQSDLVDFFVEKFKLDQDYIYERNQRRGARLQKGFTRNIIGIKEGKVVIHPRSFERKRVPENPQFAWSLIIDNSGSCDGEIIEQEKKMAVALIEVAKTLDIPLEIVVFGGPDQYTFLKTFEQEILGDDLQKVVLLNADQGTPDDVTLAAACESMKKFADQFKRSYNFVYFMTDGQGGEKQDIIEKNKRDMVITGIGLAEAASSVKSTWGESALEVPDVKKISDLFIRKIEDQIDQTFD